MSQFHTLPITIEKETDDCSVLEIHIPDELKSSFLFQQGQHLTLRAVINDEDVRRSYSLCSSPTEGKWKVAIKKIPAGVFSTYANESLATGDTIDVMEPSGDFGVENTTDGSGKYYIAFAAGSGITPILSMIKEHLAAEPNSRFQLFYLNKNVKSIIFKEELEAIKNTYFQRFEAFHFLTREHRDAPLFNGRFTEEKIERLTQTLIQTDKVDHCFMCGPEEMIKMLDTELQKHGLAEDKIHFELFVTGLSEEDKARAAAALEQKVEGTDVTIIDGAKEFHYVMSEDYDNILDAALAAGADLPYACKGGVCSTCKCEVKEGSVAMKINYALEEDEVARGLVLSCQAVPTSEKLVVDFDV